MPVNMDPAKKRQRSRLKEESAQSMVPHAHEAATAASPPRTFGEETQEDREKDLADAEQKNLWDATEVIDMDKV